MATFTQGPRPDPYAGTRRWHELTLEEQDKFLLACGFGDASWNDAMERLSLRWATASSLATAIYPFGTPPKSDAEGRQRLEASVARLGITNVLGARIQRALDRADGLNPAGPEPEIPLGSAGCNDQDETDDEWWGDADDLESHASPDSPSTKLSFDEALRAYRHGELGFRVDHGLAIRAAATGFDPGLVARSLALLFWILLLAVIPGWIFVSFWLVPVLLIASVVCKHQLKQATAAAVVRASLREERWFDLFRDRGIIKIERT